MQQNFGNAIDLVRVFAIAPSVVVRAGLEALLLTSPFVEVLGSSASFDLETIEQLQPDVLLLEWQEAEDETIWLELTSFSEFQTPAIVVLIDDWQQTSIARILRANVRGVLASESTAEEIIGAIAAVATGLTVIHPDFIDSVLSLLPETNRTLPETLSQPLTRREIEVLKMLAEGLGNKTIARRLGISEHTVKFHIGSIFNKLDASSRTEAVILGARQGLIML
ncbi:MAG: response regulator transcription factor [Xenococcaceae cyanobacterium]